ncbi:MAG: ubiquitin-conjugating enzyme E2 [archaeon]|nr:ubiquitin-conjugating enzyme E2 [archaeon]
MDKSTKRLQNELKGLQTNPVCNCIVELPNSSDIHKWQVHMAGPEGTPYAAGAFVISFVFPPNYPFKCPDVKFVTPMYHPNIKKDTGEICMDVFATSWSPTQKVSDILQKLVTLLRSPSTSSPLEADICQEYVTDYDKFCRNAKAWVAKHSA